jgi:hypothetical protein
LQQEPGVFGQGPASRRWGYATSSAFKKVDAQGPFHGPHSRTGRSQGQMAASRTGGDVAGVEDVQVEAQVGEVEVHGRESCLKGCGAWFIVIASKLAPTV